MTSSTLMLSPMSSPGHLTSHTYPISWLLLKFLGCNTGAGVVPEFPTQGHTTTRHCSVTGFCGVASSLSTHWT